MFATTRSLRIQAYAQWWVRSSGRPRNRWIDQLRQDHQLPPADLWRAAIRRDHTGATLRSSTTTRWRRRRVSDNPSTYGMTANPLLSCVDLFLFFVSIVCCVYCVLVCFYTPNGMAIFWAYIWLHGLLLMLEQSRCCKHGRRWTTATVPQVTTLISLVVYCGYAGIRPPSATRDNQSPSPWFYSARPTKRALALITVDRESCVYSKARRAAEDNRTESNCTHW